jgi:hypothetical protein
MKENDPGSKMLLTQSKFHGSSAGFEFAEQQERFADSVHLFHHARVTFELSIMFDPHELGMGRFRDRELVE